MALALAYPMIQSPALKETIWGGRKLARFGKHLPPDVPIGESWEIADHPNGCSYILNGPLAGLSLRQIIEQHAYMIYGTHVPHQWLSRFPLMVKIIDAAESLSVQVHPDDAYVAAHGIDDTGKTECWIVIEAEPNAELVVDVRPGTDPAAFKLAAQKARLDQYLLRRSVRPGDFIFIPAGRLHAIGGGILLAEFQQPGDTTFRVYDWGRTDAHGHPRPLHLDQAVECINFSGRHAASGGCGIVQQSSEATVERLADTPFFHLERLSLKGGSLCRPLNDEFQALLVIDGRVRIATGPGEGAVEAAAGTSLIIPATAGQYEINAGNGNATLLAAGVRKNNHA